VPVALDVNTFADGKDHTGEFDFFKAVHQQKPHDQGIWLAAPDGQLLGYTFSLQPREMLAQLKAGLKEFGTVLPRQAAPSNPLPYRGAGVRPDGSVQLAVSDKWMAAKDLSQLAGMPAGESHTDSVVLSATEWSNLAPPDPRAGSRWAIPEAVCRRFFPLLNPLDVGFRKPEQLTHVQLLGQVASVRDGIAYLVYRGRLEGSHDGTVKGKPDHVSATELMLAGGVGAYDIQAGQMLTLTWVWDGLHWGLYDPQYQSQRGPGARYGVVVEWRRDPLKEPAGGQKTAGRVVSRSTR
jgi:hypothetical protein